jgi:predicted metalloprotease with PDZ domain
VLAARSGLWTPEEYRDNMAQTAADLDHRPGRLWRPLIDTTVAAQLLYNAPGEWGAERRGVDFYDEGWMIWTDADTLIRQLTSGQRSLDDFVKRFHGAPSTGPMVKPYTFDDVVNTLNEVAPYDWRTFLNQRLWSTDPHAPLGGIERGGYRLTYDSVRGQHIEDLEDGRDRVEMGYSLGLRLDTKGLIADVIPGTPGFAAGLAPGTTVVAVGGKAFSPAVLRDAVSAAKSGRAQIQLLVNNEGTLINYALDYHGGELYPHLQRDNSKPDLLDQIIAPTTHDRVGIPECDEYLEKFEKCMTAKFPASIRPSVAQYVNGAVNNWQKATETPAWRADLARACKTATDRARVLLASSGCDF